MGDPIVKGVRAPDGAFLQVATRSDDDGLLVDGAGIYSGEKTDLTTTEVELTLDTGAGGAAEGRRPVLLRLRGNNILYWSKTTGRVASAEGVEVSSEAWSEPIMLLDGETIYLAAAAATTTLRYQMNGFDESS